MLRLLIPGISPWENRRLGSVQVRGTGWCLLHSKAQLLNHVSWTCVGHEWKHWGCKILIMWKGLDTQHPKVNCQPTLSCVWGDSQRSVLCHRRYSLGSERTAWVPPLVLPSYHTTPTDAPERPQVPWIWVLWLCFLSSKNQALELWETKSILYFPTIMSASGHCTFDLDCTRMFDFKNCCLWRWPESHEEIV